MKTFGKKRLSAFLALGAIILLIIAACGDSATPTPAPEVAAPEEEATATVAPEPEATEPPGGGKLVIGKPCEAQSKDPHNSPFQCSWEIHALVYEPLVFLDDDLNPVPGLATSWETPDALTYVFNLRQGVQFHNGREMVADDVVFSLNRVLDPDTASFWATKMGPIDSIEATGEHQVTVRLSDPYSPFLFALGSIMTSIVPGQEVQSGDLNVETAMIGTGPFMLIDHQEDHRWLFEKFDGYWQEGEPSLDEVEWRIIPDDSARVAALRQGEINLTFFENPKMLDLLADDADIDTYDQLTTNYYPLMINSNQEHLSDPRVRQAISLAIDREEVRQLANFGFGVLTGPLPIGFGALANPVDGLPYYGYDPDQAQTLLDEAGYSEGLTMRIWVTPDIPITVAIAEVLVQQLAEVGISVEIVQRELGPFVDDYWINGVHEAAISWWAGYSDPHLLFSNITSNGQKVLGIDEEEEARFFQLMDEAAQSADDASREAAFKALDNYLAENATLLPMVTRDNFIAWRTDQVADVEFKSVDGYGLSIWHSIKQISRN